MYVGYARVSKTDGSQSLDLQIDALQKAGVRIEYNLYQERASGSKDDRPQLEACLKSLRKGDVLFIWKLDRLGRSLKHLVETIDMLSKRGVGLKVLTGHGANIDTTTASGKLIFGIFAAFAEFERDLIRERTIAGLNAARARGRHGGRRPKLTKSQIRYLAAAMADRNTVVADLCRELDITRPTIYRYVSADGTLRPPAKKRLAGKRKRILPNEVE